MRVTLFGWTDWELALGHSEILNIDTNPFMFVHGNHVQIFGNCFSHLLSFTFSILLHWALFDLPAVI